ncbi:hypothetical protein CR513_33366, partial [Mucuna pruriens]
MGRTKIDVYVGTLSMEFGDNLVQFNIFEALKHPVEDHSIFSINGLVQEYVRIGTDSADLVDFVEISDRAETDSNMQEEAETDLVNLEGVRTVSNYHQIARSDSSQKESQQPSLHSDRVGQSTPSTIEKIVSPQSPATKLKPLPEHLKYAYLQDHQQIPMIITNNLNQE